MILNKFLTFTQSTFKNLYEKSILLKMIDNFIFIFLLLLVFSMVILPSDNIGYFAIIIIILTFIKLITKPNERFELLLSDKILLVYFLTVLISLAGSSLFYLSLKGFCKTLVYLSFYVSLISFFKNNFNKVKYIFIAFILAVSFEFIIAFLQNFVSVAEISGWQDMSRLNPEEIMTRVYGTLKPYNPNLFGGFLLATIPVFLSFYKKHKVFSLSGFLLGCFTIILTGCRGAYVGLFIEILALSIILFIKFGPNLRKIFTLFITICFTVFSIIVSMIPALRARFYSIFAMRNDSSNSFRFNVYNSCIDMFKDNWLVGIGIGNQNFREIYGLYMRTGFDALSAYNIYLEMAVESGIFSLIAFITFIISIFRSVLKNFKTLFVLSAFLSIVGILVHGLVDTVFFRPQIQFTFWLMVAILRGGYDIKTN